MKKFISSLLANTRDRRKRGFTLIELLIVIGILGILVVAVLLTLNPAEAQRKTRDAKRMKDLGTLQAVLQQYIDNNGAVPGTTKNWLTPNVTAFTASDGACDGTGWIATPGSLCNYINKLPNDPSASATKSCAGPAGTGVGSCNAGATPQPMRYRVCMDANGVFAVNVRQESQANLNNVTNDGGVADSWAEVTNAPTGTLPPGQCGAN